MSFVLVLQLISLLFGLYLGYTLRQHYKGTPQKWVQFIAEKTTISKTSESPWLFAIIVYFVSVLIFAILVGLQQTIPAVLLLYTSQFYAVRGYAYRYDFRHKSPLET